MMASANSVHEWVQPFVNDQGTLAEIIKGIQQELEAITRSIDIAEDGFRIESALGLSLDALGALFGHKRQDGLGDNDYRNQLLTLVEDSTSQTVDVVERTVEWISGYTPTVEEPDPGTIRVRLPLNKVQYAADVYAQLNRVKAAGIRVIVGHLEEFFESFSETLLVTDYLLNLMRGMFYETFATPWPLIGGSGQWDWGNWDASGAKWDSSDEPSDDLLIWWTHQLTDTYSDANWDDALFLIGILYPPSEPETLSTPTDVLLFDGVLYQTEWYVEANLEDDLDFSGLLILTEWLSPVLSDEDLFFDGILYQTESYAEANLEDSMDRIGVLLEEIWRPLGWDGGQWDVDLWDDETCKEELLVLWTQEFSDSYSDTNWDDDLFFIGVLYPPVGPETLGTPTDALLFDGVLYFSDDLSGFYDESILLKGILYGTESLSDYEDELERIGLLFTEPTLSTPTDAMSGAIVGYFIEPTLPIPDDDILIAWGREFEEVYPRRVARIGSAKIGTNVIGFGIDVTYSHEWDSGEWDSAWWDRDNSEIMVIIRDVF